MLNLLNPHFDKIFVSRANVDRAATINEIKTHAGEIGDRLITLEEPCNYILDFRKEDENRCLVILGSIYLVGEIKSKIIEKNA